MASIVDIYELTSEIKFREQNLEDYINLNTKITEKILKYFNECSVLLSKFGFEKLIERLVTKFHDYSNKKRPYRYTRPPVKRIGGHRRIKSDGCGTIMRDMNGEISFSSTRKKSPGGIFGSFRDSFRITRKNIFSKRSENKVTIGDMSTADKRNQWEMDATIFKGLNVTFWE